MLISSTSSGAVLSNWHATLIGKEHAKKYGLQVSATDVVTVVQTGMPMTALSVLGGQFRLKAQARAQLYQDFLPWAVRAGFRSADLMCLYYEKHFEVRHLENMLH